ncbi:hypothetical protein [Phenylobacterium sp.]|uniref:hypothetical protein n=1 Tax=Phenylobacterium sp. TaxID=1871053 RepID=UPI0028A02E89|nr:hypothetical protein [Phenylobacterium sp.]
MLAPITPVLEEAVDQAGRTTAYWDPAWASWCAQTLFLIAGLILFLGVAGLEWLTVQVAGGLSRLVGDRRVRPQPFAYFALTTAGAIAGLAAAFSLIMFAAAPVNAPVWAWLSRPEGAVFAVGGGLVIMTLIFRRDRVVLDRILQIYGGGRRAYAYQAAAFFLVVGALSAAIALLQAAGRA